MNSNRKKAYMKRQPSSDSSCSFAKSCPTATPWTAAHQASLSFTVSQVLKLMYTELVIPSIHLILCLPFLLLPSIFPSIRIFPHQSALGNRWPKYWSFTSVLPMSVHGWFPLGLIGLISLLFEGLSRVFSINTFQKHQLFGLLYGPTLTSIHDYKKNHSFDYTDFC